VSSGDYPYPPDEFDAPGAAVAPDGAHRAPRSRWQRIASFVLVLILFPLLAYGVVTWLSDRQSGPGASAVTMTDDSGEGSQTTSPTTSPTESAAPSEPAATTEPTTPPAPQADLARQVDVFNSTSTSGLAAKAAKAVQAAGFTKVTAKNWTGKDPAKSVVYYPAPADIATAQAVADALGISTVTESASAAVDRVVVVLASDYKP
jgi:cytoskeletal protein RodZ